MKLNRTPNSSQKRISETFQNVKRNAPQNQRKRRNQRPAATGRTKALSKPKGSVRNQAIMTSNNQPTTNAPKVGRPQETSRAAAASKPRRSNDPIRT